MLKIAVFGKRFGEPFYEKCVSLFEFLKCTSVQTFIYRPFYEFLSEEARIATKPAALFDSYSNLPECNLFFSIGGDGTFLDAVTIVRNRNIPIVGINTGRLGFLADISMNELPQVLPEILNGRYFIRKVELLNLETKYPYFGDINFALNELAIHKRDSSSMITIHAYLDDRLLNSYWADGLIIATPTGSTAYSLSVGGPILHPSCREFIISPIAPHNLTVRPMVVPNNVKLTLKVEGRGGKFMASLDSRSQVLDNEIELHVSKALFTISVAETTGRNFYSTLRSKLMWGADNRN
ncbi:MAG: NAD kinase [Cytophagaceae bacterium]|jgi:NAD+ kinase|nr:NAD kinase [Cytophagaceae bacterium]